MESKAVGSVEVEVVGDDTGRIEKLPDIWLKVLVVECEVTVSSSSTESEVVDLASSQYDDE